MGTRGSSTLETTGPPSTSRPSTPTTCIPTSSARSTPSPTTPRRRFPSVPGFAEFNWDRGGVAISPTAANSGGGSSTARWLPRPNLHREHEFALLRPRHHPRFQRSKRLQRFQSTHFELKTYDLSNLSGQSIKARFPSSQTPMWKAMVASMMPGLKSMSSNPRARGCPIPSVPIHCSVTAGWMAGTNNPTARPSWLMCWTLNTNPSRATRTSLPVPVAVDPAEHPTVHVRVRMATNDNYVTPLVHSLSVSGTTYIGPQHIVNSPVATTPWWTATELRIPGSFTLRFRPWPLAPTTATVSPRLRQPDMAHHQRPTDRLCTRAGRGPRPTSTTRSAVVSG